MCDFRPQELSVTALAFATAGHSDAPLFRMLARMVEPHLSSLNAQNIANIAWAFATLGLRQDERLFATLAREAEKRANKFTAQGIANTVWALATLSSHDGMLFAILAGPAERRVSEFKAQSIANTA